MKLEVISPSEVQSRLAKKEYPAQASYLAMYSSWWGGIITEPSAMVVPVDDHLVHRGDGVFEAIKVINGKIFLLNEHMARLQTSAEKIALALPYSLNEMIDIMKQTLAAAKTQNALLRLYISRGPGGFTTNPYECLGSQMYLVVTEFKPVAAEKYARGVHIGRSAIPVKESWLATTKTCNYLPNVMMKKESVDRKLDFTIGFDQQNFLTESSTENIVIVDKNGNLVRPFLRNILKGTTMVRAFELAKKLQEQGLIRDILEKDITEDDLIRASEVMMIGTTLDVLPVTRYEDKELGQGDYRGQVGPVAKALLALLRTDIEA